MNIFFPESKFMIIWSLSTNKIKEKRFERNENGAEKVD